MNTPENGLAVKFLPSCDEKQYTFFLYVKGASPNSMRAITNIKHLLEIYLSGSYSLKVIDVHQQYVSLEKDLMMALPLIVRMFPFPQRRCSGDMSDVQNVLTCLGLLNCL